MNLAYTLTLIYLTFAKANSNDETINDLVCRTCNGFEGGVGVTDKCYDIVGTYLNANGVPQHLISSCGLADQADTISTECKSAMSNYIGCTITTTPTPDLVCRTCNGFEGGVGVTDKCYEIVGTYLNANGVPQHLISSCGLADQADTISTECKSEISNYIGCTKDTRDICEICDRFDPKGGSGITRACFTALRKDVRKNRNQYQYNDHIDWFEVVNMCGFGKKTFKRGKISKKCKLALSTVTGCACKDLNKTMCNKKPQCAIGVSKRENMKTCIPNDNVSNYNCSKHKHRKGCIEAVVNNSTTLACKFVKKKDPCLKKCCMAKNINGPKL